jgi:hypothetical protein
MFVRDHSQPWGSAPTRARGISGSRGLATLARVLVISILTAGESAAQYRPEILQLPPEVTGYIRMGGILYENLFQLPNDGPRRDVPAGVLELRVEESLGRDDAFRAYTRADVFQFQQLGFSPGIQGGLRRVQGANQFDLSLSVQWNRPRFDRGDELEQANVLAANGSYTLMVVSSLELIALAEYQRDSLKLKRDQDSESHDLGGALRYRAFGRHVTAEVGVMQGARETSRPDQEYVQETQYVLVRTTAIPRTYLSVRYRTRLRDYIIEDAKSRNFGRQDRRQQMTCYLDIALWGNLVWNLSGGFEQGESTRTTSAFRSKQFATTFSVMLPGS